MTNRSLRLSVAAICVFVGVQVAPADGVVGLSADDVKGALDSNAELAGKIFGRVDFHVIDPETGEVVHVESLLPQAPSAAAGALSYPISLPAGQRCVAPKLTKTGAGVIVDWCDPGNLNLLQSDIYQMNFNGSKGNYLISYRAISCATESANIPEDVYIKFCPAL